MGECTKETAEGMLDFFYENGGNFIDTSVSRNLYLAMADHRTVQIITRKGSRRNGSEIG